MSALYDTPARPWAFGPFVGRDIVAQQAEALVQRYDLLDALAAGGQVRRDLDPWSPADPRLRDVIGCQLVPWVDYVPDAGAPDNGWPIPQGVRVEALCYSSWLDPLRASDGTIEGKQVFPLPRTAIEFAQQFYVRSGIQVTRVIDYQRVYGLDAEFEHAFRFTPLVAGEVAVSLRRAGGQAERAFRLLMSREFEASCDADPRLLVPHPILQAGGFKDQAIVAFERLAEISRIGMTVREVDRFAAGGCTLRTLLERANDAAFVAANSVAPGVAYAPQLGAALAADPALLALCDYLAVGTDVLASWRKAVIAERGTFQAGFRPAAWLAGGSIYSDTAFALSWMVDVRTAFLSAFDPPRASTAKPSALHNDMLAKFYGLTNFRSNLASALMADFTHKRSVGAPTGPRGQGPTAKNTPHDVRESIGEIVNQLGRDGRPENTRLNAVRVGAPLSRVMLPKRPVAGSAARADDGLWRCRYRDQPFWARFQNPDASWFAQLSMRPRDRETLRGAITDLRSLALADLDWAPSSLTAKVVADLATGVSAISINPAFTRSIRRLVRLNGLMVRAENRWTTLRPVRRMAIATLARFGSFTHGRRKIENTESLSNPARLRKRKSK